MSADIDSAQGKFIIMGDADDSYGFLEVPRFIAKWREGNEIVLGNQFGGEIKKGAMPWLHKYLGNSALVAVLNLFFRAGIGDVWSALRCFTSELYRCLDMQTSGMKFAVEFVLKVDPMIRVIDWMGSVSPESGFDQHQSRIPTPDLVALLRKVGFERISHRKFELGLNNLLLAIKPGGDPTPAPIGAAQG